MGLYQREAFARLFEHMCRHDGDGGHGYSQYARLGDGTTERVDLGDGVVVTIAGGDRDCSSAVLTCLKAVGVDVRGASFTGNEIDICQTGQFVAHKRANGRCVDGYVARRGDIYLASTHHTAICLSSDPDLMAQFSISELGKIYGKKGDQTGQESNIRPFRDFGCDYTLAWANDGAYIEGEDEEVKEEDIQRIAQLAADKVVNYKLNGVLLRDRIIGTDQAANDCRKQLTRTDDPSGRKTKATLYERMTYMGKKMDAVMKKLGA